MGLTERLALYKKIETHRKHPLICYVTSKRHGVEAMMASDALPALIEQLDALPNGAKEIDFLIVSFGGDPMVAWRIMSLIRERAEKVYVLVPQSAYSAATLVTLGADQIIMHPNGHLGPIDMQISTLGAGRFSTEDISAFVEFVRKDLAITDQEHLRSLFEVTCREVGSIGVGFNARSQKLALRLAERLLSMPEATRESGPNRTMVENLSHQFHSHNYPVSRSEAIEMGLPVNEGRDATLEGLMWEVWLDLEAELKEREPFDPIMEILRSPDANQLLDPPQTALQPVVVPTPGNPGQNVVPKTGFQPIDYGVIDAIIESERLASWLSTRGKILASRQPDLNIIYNTLVSFRGWEKKHPA